MQANSENRICQNCKQSFVIESEDFLFYQKIKVPPPTFCPKCRLQRRLAWMISLVLFKRKCDLCGVEGISMYEPNAPYRIYCHKCWWGDGWNPKDYARDYDFSRPFLLQWNELLHETPILGLSIDTISGDYSPYTNHCGHAKNCYLIYYSDDNEDCMYGFYLARNKSVLNCSMIGSSQWCFDGKNNFKNYSVIGSYDTIQSLDSAFLRDCVNCQRCFGSANLKNKSNVFFNEQLSKEDYEKKIVGVDLGSHLTYSHFKKLSEENWSKFVPKPQFDDFSKNFSGTYVFESKNCHECYEVVGVQDSKFIMLIKTSPVKDSYDYTDWGSNASRLYECVTVGENVANMKFCHESGFNLNEIEYSKLQTGGSYCFGCVSIKKGEYCILNKKYPEKEFFALREKIIKHMNDMPYVDKVGRIYKYGEFFPMEFSPHAYNNTFSNFFFPKTKTEAIASGLNFYEPNPKEYSITMPSSDLPDHIKDTPDEITKEIIGCGTCLRGYKITKQEIDMSRRMNVPLSRECPFCRIGFKIKKWVSQMKQVSRICDKCGSEFSTHYTKEEAPNVICKKCYLSEVA